MTIDKSNEFKEKITKLNLILESGFDEWYTQLTPEEKALYFDYLLTEKLGVKKAGFGPDSIKM